MEDIAVLGLAVESSSLPSAELRLTKLAATAAATEKSTKSLTAATVDLGVKAQETARRFSQYDEAYAKSIRTASMAAEVTNRAAAAHVAAAQTTTRAAQAQATALANASRQADGFARLAQQTIADSSRTRTRELMTSVAASTESIKAMYFGAAAAATSAATTIVSANNRIAASTGPAVGYMGRPGQVGLNAQQKTMLGYQLQDVFAQMSAGTNPLVVAAQQGPQISMLYGGVGNMIRAIPRPLLIGGGIAAAAGGSLFALNSLAEGQDERRLQDRRLGGDGTGMFRDIAGVATAASIAVDKATESVEGFARATRGLGASRQDVLGLAESIEKLIKLGGANDNEASAAREGVAGMLKQATISADQLKAVLGNVPGIASQIAAGLGVSVTQLRLMASEGELTNRKVLEAMLQRSAAVNAEFEAMPKSVGDLFSSIGTDLGVALKNLADSIPLVNRYREALELAAKAAKAIKEASAAETPQQVIARTSGAGAGIAPIGLAAGLSPGAAAGSMVAQRDFYAAQFDVGAQEVQRWAQSVRDAVRAADEGLVVAAGAARKFDQLSAAYRENQRDIEAMEKALADLQSGLTSLSATEAANQIGILTGALQRAREAARDIDPALRSLNDISRRSEWRANDPSAAGMALQGRIQDLVNQGSNRQDATTAALAEQQEKIAGIVKAKQEEAAASDKITAAMGRGKKALIEAQTKAAVLAFIMANVGKNTELAADQIQAFRDAVKTILTNESIQGGVNAAKPLLDELAGIAAAMKVVEQGAYAMKRAEAEAKAARDENGTGGLQMQVFDARQKLADAATLDTLRQEIDLTNKLAAAAGDVAKQKGLQLDYDIKKAQQNADPASRELIATEMRAKAAAELRRETAEGAAEIEKQVDLTNQQIEILRSGSADYAAQLAMLQKKNELLARGVDLASEEAQRQVEATGNLARANVERDRAKEAADATKRIWMNAFDNIQGYGADVFFDVFRGAQIDGKTVAESLKNIFLRTFAEIAAAAVIRPIIAPIFGAASSIGLMPGGVAPAVYGGGGGAGFSMPSIGGSWGGSWLSGIGDWLHTPLTGPYAGLSPSAMQGVPMLEPSIMNPSSWGITPLQGLGALAGAGMGIYQLATSKSTAGTIGGIASLVGAGVSLIPGVGQIAGPIISILGSILPSLFGETKPTITNQAYGQLTYGAGGWGTSGGAWGPNANAGSLQGPLGQIGKTMDAVFGEFGGVKDAGKVWGLALESFAQQYGDGSNFANQTSYLVDPSGGKRQWGQGSTEADIGTGAAAVAATLNSILGGAVGEISANMRKALETVNQSGKDTMEVLAGVVREIKTYDEVMKGLGKTVTGAEQALKAVDDQFASLKATAEKYKLDDLAEVEKKKADARLKVATDFADGLQRQYDDLTGNTIKGALADIKKAYDDAVANNKYLVENVKGATDQILLIEKLFNEQRTKIAIDMWQQVPDLARGQYLFGERLKLNEQLRAINDDTAAIGANPMETQIKAWQREIGQFMKGVGDVFGAGSEEYRNATVAAYRRFNAQMKAANDDFIQTMRDMVTALEDPFKAQIDGILRQRDAAMQAARALDASGKLLVEASLAYAAPLEKMGRDFNKSIRDQLLQMRDPLAFALQQNREARDADIRKATQINEALQQVYQPTIDAIIERATSYDERGNLTVAVTDAGDQAFLRRISDNYVKMVDITELYLQKEQRLKEDYYRQTLTGLDDLIKRLSYGDLSGLSPTATLAGTRGAYQAAYAQAAADPRNQANLDRFTALGADLSTQLRSYHGSSEQYYRDIASIRANAEAVRSMVTGGSASSSSGTVDPGVQAAMNSNTELTRALLAEMQRMREENQELAYELKRLLSKVAA